MSDLISRSALIELIQKDIEKTASFMNIAEKYDGSFDKLYGQLNTLRNYKSIISDIPTAYVIDNVIREIDDDIAYIEADDTKEKFVHYESVESAIRKGGLEYE